MEIVAGIPFDPAVFAASNRFVAVDTPLGTRYRYLAPDLADVAAVADAPETDDTGGNDAQPLVARAYVHRHDPHTMTVHPWKDTPLGDAA